MTWAELMNQVHVLKYGAVALLACVLVLGHGIVLYRLSSHKAGAIVLGLILLALLKHVGLFGPIYGMLKRHYRGAR